MGIIKTINIVSVLLLTSTIGSGQNNMNIQGHEYVDLGLSVYWATCNIGANDPESLGDYFAWGETYTKSCYNKMTYKFAGETLGATNLPTIDAEIKAMVDYTKYLGNENKQTPNDVKLDIADDVANVQWGNPWRMPTKDEIEELVDSCDWVLDDIKGVIGYWAISKVNKNKIFFPLAGYIYDDVVTDVGKAGKYWASELRPDMCFEAYQIWISYEDDLAKMQKKPSIFLSDDGFREYGRCVRAVVDKKHK